MNLGFNRIFIHFLFCFTACFTSTSSLPMKGLVVSAPTGVSVVQLYVNMCGVWFAKTQLPYMGMSVTKQI